MSSMKQEAAGWAMTFGQFDDGLPTWYSVDLDATPNYVQHNGIERTGIRFETGSAGIGQKVQSVRVRFRKYGSNW
jgi:hypothetical protein